MSKSDYVPISPAALATAVADYRAGEEAFYKEAMSRFHDRYDPALTARRWFGLLPPHVIGTPTDEDLFHHYEWTTVAYSYRWEEAQNRAATLDQMIEIATGDILLNSKTVEALFFE